MVRVVTRCALIGTESTMAGEAGQISKTIVEVYVETDSESEPYSSSEGEDGSEATLTAQEGALEEHVELSEPVSPEPTPDSVPQQVPPPPIIASSADIAPGDSPFPELLDQESGFDLYDPESEMVVTPPEIETQEIEMEEVGVDETLSGEVVESFAAEPDVKSSSHSPPVYSSSAAEHPIVSQPKEETAPVIKHDPEMLAMIGFCEPPDNNPTKLYCLCQEPATFSMIPCHKCQNWFHGECVGLTRQKAATVKQFFCPLCIDKDPSLVTSFESRAEREAILKKERGQISKGGSKKSGKKHSRRCGECSGCVTVIDCRKCRFCRDMPKYGGPGRQRQKCIKRQCLRFSRILYTDDPLHNKGAVMQDEMVAELKAAGSSVPVEGGRSETTLAGESGFTDTGSGRYQAGLEEWLPNQRAAALKQTTPHSSAAKKRPGPSQGPPAKKGRVGGAKGGGRGRKKQGKPAANSMKGGRAKKPARTRLSISDFDGVSQRQRRPFSTLLGGLFRDEVHTPQQCLGPECVFAARPHSKYCSEECGVKLALKRIKTFFPERRKLVKKERGETIATKMNKEKLEQLNNEQKSIKHRLEELDRQTHAIDRHIEKMSSVSPVKEDDSHDADSDDLTIHCSTCSQPVTLKKAMVHLERCFNKMEGLVSFGSIVRNEGTNIFCDKYDVAQKTYCKRLRVLCPEHTKEPKISPDDVCGCPFDPDFPSKVHSSKRFCRQPKKSCVQHYCWEKLRRAEIDQEKLNLFLKLEDVGEQCRLHQWQIEHRESFLSLMLHRTVSHEGGSSKRKKNEEECDNEMITEPS